MRLFGWVITREEHAPVPLQTRVEHAEKALEKLTRTVHELGLEWESVLDKIARYTARQAARTKRQIEADTSAEVASGATAQSAEPVPPAVTARMPKQALRAALASGQLRKLGG